MHMYSAPHAHFGQGGERPGRPGHVSFSCVDSGSAEDVVVVVDGSGIMLVIMVLGAFVVAAAATTGVVEEGVSVVCSRIRISQSSFSTPWRERSRRDRHEANDRNRS